jgi:hypothetical protein
MAKKEGIKIEKVTVGFGMTLNLGNYESFRVDAQVVLSIPPDRDLIKGRKEAFAEGWKIVEDELKRQVIAVRKETGGGK